MPKSVERLLEVHKGMAKALLVWQVGMLLVFNASTCVCVLGGGGGLHTCKCVCVCVCVWICACAQPYILKHVHHEYCCRDMCHTVCLSTCRVLRLLSSVCIQALRDSSDTNISAALANSTGASALIIWNKHSLFEQQLHMLFSYYLHCTKKVLCIYTFLISKWIFRLGRRLFLITSLCQKNTYI